MQAITQKKPLCTIHQSNEEKIFVEIKVEDLDEKMKNSYMIIKGQRISTARNLIRKYGESTPIEYYQYFILPSLPEGVKSRMIDLFARLPPDIIEKTSLETILRKQKEFK